MTAGWRYNASSVLDREGSPIGAILVFHDLTRIKQLENTRQEFVANVSHETAHAPLLDQRFCRDAAGRERRTIRKKTTRFLQTIEKHTDRLDLF
jgi:two-component system phosphate regulon sensor histidine kinase PhoR